MNWRLIAFSALALAGCARDGGSGDGDVNAPPAPPEAYKISLYRPFLIESGGKKKWEPHYRVVFSEGWKDKVGEGISREPFGKAAPGRNYSGYQPDHMLRRYFALLKDKFEIDKLNESPPEKYRPEELYKSATDPHWAQFTRIVTIGTDTWHKSYYYRDHHTTPEEMRRFAEAEKFVMRVCESAIQLRIDVKPAVATDR